MNAKILPLDVNANIYVVLDDSGTSIGTGTREVCEVLARIATSANGAPDKRNPALSHRSMSNIRSAITI